MKQTFSDLGVKAALVVALSKNNIVDPTPIQIASIPLLLEQKDAYLQAETGTGKTLAYLLPTFSKIDPRIEHAQVIIFAPTHELAIQIQRQCSDLAQQSNLLIRNILLIGGASIDRQLEKIKKKPHIVIGSPGRIRDIIEARKLKTHLVNTIVVDEADRLLASESVSHIKAILKFVPKDRQSIFVSATERQETLKEIAHLSSNAIVVKASVSAVSPTIEHLFLVCEERDRAEALRKIIHAEQALKSIVFVHKNIDAEFLANRLNHHKLKVVDIHSTLDKQDRKNAMDKVRNGKVDVLIASDVAARGLDIKGVTHVFNYDVPSSSESYLHRVGRSGRAGNSGIAISLVTEHQKYLIERFTKDLGVKFLEVYLRNAELHRVIAA